MNRIRRILVVEDCPDIMEVLKMGLEMEGYEVLHAADGLQALAKLESAPDLILLDLFMPNMNGFEFLEHIKAKGLSAAVANIPILVMSASSAARLKGLEGVHGFISKPLAFETLLSEIRRLCP